MVALLVAWKTWGIFLARGLFTWLGTDFAAYYVQATALRLGAGPAIYDPAALAPLAALVTPYGAVAAPYTLTLVPYPPLYAWLFAPLTLLAPPLSFAVWTALNLAAATYLGWRVSTFFAPSRRRWIVPLVLLSYPAQYSLFLGQPMLLLAAAIGEMYLSLRAGREFRAGLWLALLAFKPQYGLLLGLLLLWKRRWRAVAGAAAGLGVIGLGSALAAGPSVLLAWPAAIALEGGRFRGDGIGSFPEQMMNWRSLVLKVNPWIGDEASVLLTLALGALTVASLVPALRGPWDRRDPLFASKLTLVLLATLIASYHSHPYGPVLLLVPAAALLAEERPAPLTRLALLAGLVIPAFTYPVTDKAGLFVRLLGFAAFAVLLASLLWVRLPARQQARFARLGGVLGLRPARARPAGGWKREPSTVSRPIAGREAPWRAGPWLPAEGGAAPLGPGREPGVIGAEPAQAQVLAGATAVRAPRRVRC